MGKMLLGDFPCPGVGHFVHVTERAQPHGSCNLKDQSMRHWDTGGQNLCLPSSPMRTPWTTGARSCPHAV